MSDFLPTNYEVPASNGHYLKFENGDNRFRILDRPILGWVYWTNETKPCRLKEKPNTLPDDIQVKDGKKTSVKHFWAFPVWNYKTKQVEICEITQVSIQKAIEALAKDVEWGSPLSYDIKVSRSGEGLTTEYQVMPQPHKTLDEAIEKVWEDTKCDLNKLFTGDDPFAG